MSKRTYLARRLALGLLVLFGVSVVTFLIARLIPSDPAALYAGPRPTKAQIAELRVKLGLDQPQYVQYLNYIGGYLRGDLGVSFRTHQPILEDLKHYLPATLELVTIGACLALIVGVPLGVLAGARPNSWLDHLIRVVSIAGVSLPIFWLALLLQLLFFGYLGWLPLGGRVDNAIALNSPVRHITGFNLIDSTLTGNWAALRSTVLHLILPSFCVAAYPIGLASRMIRTKTVETLSEPYITAARAAGIPNRTILFKFALKNAIMPAITVLGLSFAYSITGSFLVEVVFLWPGVGRYVTEAIMSLDFPVVIAVTLVVTVCYIGVNLFVDLLQFALDPRVTFD